MNVDEFVKRTDEIISLGTDALAHKSTGDYGTGWIQRTPFGSFRSASLSFLIKLFGDRHPYFTDFNEKVTSTDASDVEMGLGILRSVRTELVGGWLVSARGLISAEIFADFLEMSQHLLAEQYKDAAAVIAGSSLEEHLRQLAAKYCVPVTQVRGQDTFPKRADTLNAELAAAGAYSKLDQKSVTAWLDLRNKAAHGKYTEYDHGQVALMLEGIRQFIARASL